MYTRFTNLHQLKDHYLLTLLLWGKKTLDFLFTKIPQIMNNFKAIIKETLLALLVML